MPGTDVVAALDVYDAAGGEMLAVLRDVRREEFGAADQYQAFALEFSNPADSTLEFRVAWHDNADLNVDKIVVAVTSG